MDANDVNLVLEKVAEKLGVAVDALKPAMDVLATEYGRYHLICSLAAFSIAGLMVLVAAWLVRTDWGDKKDNVACRFATTVVTAIVALPIPVALGIHHLACAFAPHLGVLQTLLH